MERSKVLNKLKDEFDQVATAAGRLDRHAWVKEFGDDKAFDAFDIDGKGYVDIDDWLDMKEAQLEGTMNLVEERMKERSFRRKSRKADLEMGDAAPGVKSDAKNGDAKNDDRSCCGELAKFEQDVNPLRQTFAYSLGKFRQLSMSDEDKLAREQELNANKASEENKTRLAGYFCAGAGSLGVIAVILFLIGYIVGTTSEDGEFSFDATAAWIMVAGVISMLLADVGFCCACPDLCSPGGAHSCSMTQCCAACCACCHVMQSCCCS